MSSNPGDNKNFLQNAQIGKYYNSIKNDEENPQQNFGSEENGFCSKIWNTWNIGLFVGAIVVVLILMILMIVYK